MSKGLFSIIVAWGVLAFGIQAYALSLSPGDADYNGVTNPTATPRNSQSNINNVIFPLMEGGEEIFTFVFTPNGDLSGGEITDITGVPNWLLVKDGNHTPWWYLFELPALDWANETILLSGFWPDGGAISHVSLYGSSAPVPEPGTLLLLGAGLLGLALYGRKRMKG